MKNKKLIVGLCATVLALALMMLMPVNATAQGTWQKVTLFSDDFNVNETVDWTGKWATEGNQSYYDVKYRALEVSADFDLAPDENWSQMIHTKYGYENTTLYETDDFYYALDFVYDPPFSVYKGFVDQYYLNTSTMKNYAGIVGALFEHEYFGEQDYSTIKVWWVDNVNTYQEYNTTLPYIAKRWYTVDIIYNMTTDSATVTITDTVTKAFAMKNLTHIKDPATDVKMFVYAYSNWEEQQVESKLPSPMGVNPPSINLDIYEVCYVDNVEVYTYSWVTEPVTPTPPTEPVLKNYVPDIGAWLAVIGTIVAVVGVIFYSNLEAYLADSGVLNSGAVATSVAIVGVAVALIGGLLYYNPYGWVVTDIYGWQP